MNDRVVAFDINADRSNAPVISSARPTPSQRPHRPRHTNRAMARAQLASVYAGLLGAEISAADLLEHIQIAAGSGKLGLDEMAAAFRGVGLSAKVDKAPKWTEGIWPALALMNSDQMVLVLGQSEGVVEDLLAELADVVANLVLDLGQLCLGLLSHLDHVELGVDVA